MSLVPARTARVLALVAALAFALVPTLSRALAPAAGGSPGAMVCTPQGLQPAPADAPATQGHVEACALCALGGAAAPAPDRLAHASPRATAPSLPAQAQGPQARPIWRAAAPRAPPRQR